MRHKTTGTPAQTPTTAQSLGSLIKSARDIMRKDKGLNGDLDRLPMLTWVMFLKFLDDLEMQREQEASLAGKKFRLAILPVRILSYSFSLPRLPVFAPRKCAAAAMTLLLIIT